MTRDEYLRDVGNRLRDLPWSVRRDLLAELRVHLDELPVETDLRARLGPAETYAADLRSAAGLERRHGPITFLRARRPRTVILAVVVLVLAGLAIGAFAWTQSYQPLAFAGSEVLPAGSTNTQTADGYAASVGYHKGRPFRLGIQIRNTGRFTVRVLGVPYSSDVPWQSRTLPWSSRLMMATETAVPPPPGLHGEGWHQGPFEPFHPFDLEPGHSSFLLLKGVYANCHVMISVGTIPLSDFPIRFSFLWKTTTAHVPLPGGLTIAPPNNPRIGCA